MHEYLRSKLCSLYENDCIFDKFECCWNGSDGAIMTGNFEFGLVLFLSYLPTEVISGDGFQASYNLPIIDIFLIGSYNNFFRMFERSGRKEVTFEASREIAKPKTMLKPRKVSTYVSECSSIVLRRPTAF